MIDIFSTRPIVPGSSRFKADSALQAGQKTVVPENAPAFGQLQSYKPVLGGDSVHFSGAKKDKIKKKASRAKRWMATYALSLALIPAGLASTTAGIVGATSHPTSSTPVVRMTNPQDLGSPVEIKGADAVAQADVQNEPTATEEYLRPNSRITAQQANDYAEAGDVTDISRKEGAGDEYSITVEDHGTRVTVNVQLNQAQYQNIQTLKAFGASQSNPLDAETPTALPEENDSLTPSGLLSYARAGMLLQLDETKPVRARGAQQPEGTKPYKVILTDGEHTYEETLIDLTNEQLQLVEDAADGKIAQYRGEIKSGGGADREDLLLILQGLGLVGLGAGLGNRKRKTKDLITTSAPVPKPDFHETPYRSRAEQPELIRETASADSAPKKQDVAEGLEQQLPAGFTYPQVGLDDMAGIARQTREDVEELMEILTTDQETMDRLGIDPIKGALLYGPPGTGKTMMAEAIAHETGRLYKCISASSLKTVEFKGTGIKKILAEFAAVKEAAKSGRPILLQIDEVDGLFGDRTNAHDDDSQSLNQFLTEVDKLHKEAPNVVILYTTNHLKKLDDAAIRNGRVDYKIKVPLPATMEQRLEILQLYTQKPKPKTLGEDANLPLIAEKAQGFSPIDLKALMNKATIRARLNQHDAVMQQDLLEALQMIDRQRKKDGSVLTSVERPTTTFDDLGGLDEIVPRFREIAQQFNRMAESTTRVSLDVDDEDVEIKPMLLEGTPGTGKTELGRAMANEAKCNFMYVNGAEFEDGIIGHGAANVRKLFEDARENAPTIIFIDEADAAFRKRGGPNSNEEREATLNQLLTEMNGISPNDGVFVMAATNRADIMDAAALSRFESVSVPKPNHPTQRRQILDIMSRKRPLAKDVNLDALAEDTSGYSGRDLKSLFQIANRQKRNAGRKEINREDMDNAVDIFELGEKSVYPGSEQAVKLVGVHEIIGHGLTTMALKRRFPEIKVRAVTMEARRPKEGGQVLGFVRPYIPDDITYTSIACYLGQLLLSAGGRASERVIVGKEQEGADTAGGGSDYQKMEQVVIHMLQSGMIPGFSPNQFAKSKQELTPEEKQVVDYLIGQAEEAAETLINTAVKNGPQKMVDLVDNGIAAKTVRNEKAEALFTDVLDRPSDWTPLYDVVDNYIATVIGQLKQNAREKQSAFVKNLPAS